MKNQITTAAAVGASLLAGILVLGCGDVKDAVEDSIDGEATELKEPDMPNCSRVVNCCAYLADASLTPEDVNTACAERIDPSANTLIDSYQSAKRGLENDNTLTDESRQSLLADLKSTYQERVEPGCRCFLDETVGDISVDGFLSPQDCEFVEEVGDLEPPNTCEDAQGALVDLASDPPTVDEGG